MSFPFYFKTLTKLPIYQTIGVLSDYLHLHTIDTDIHISNRDKQLNEPR